MMGKIIALMLLASSLLLIYPALSRLAEHGADGSLMTAAAAIYVLLAALAIVLILAERWGGDGETLSGEELDPIIG